VPATPVIRWWSTDHRAGTDYRDYQGSRGRRVRRVSPDSQAGPATTDPSACPGRRATVASVGRGDPWEKRVCEERKGRRASLECPGSLAPLDEKWVLYVDRARGVSNPVSSFTPLTVVFRCFGFCCCFYQEAWCPDAFLALGWHNWSGLLNVSNTQSFIFPADKNKVDLVTTQILWSLAAEVMRERDKKHSVGLPLQD